MKEELQVDDLKKALDENLVDYHKGNQLNNNNNNLKSNVMFTETEFFGACNLIWWEFGLYSSGYSFALPIHLNQELREDDPLIVSLKRRFANGRDHKRRLRIILKKILKSAA